ncbi:MAG: hypothetical protein QM784_39885 [Polyangiaceae bacterium]
MGTKLAFAQAKRVPEEVFKRLNQDVSRRLLVGFGARRGGLLIGAVTPLRRRGGGRWRFQLRHDAKLQRLDTEILRGLELMR